MSLYDSDGEEGVVEVGVELGELLEPPPLTPRPRLWTRLLTFVAPLRTLAFWRKYWWRIGLYVFLLMTLSTLGVALVISLIFSTGLTTRWAALLFAGIALILAQIIASAVYFLFPSHRNVPSLKRRGKFVAAESLWFLLLVEVVVLLVLPPAFLFSSADFSEVGDLNINLRSPRGVARLKALSCDFDSHLASVQTFFGCSLNVSTISFYWGGAPRAFPGSASGMTIFAHVFLEGPDYCPSSSLLSHELFHSYQYARGQWSAALLAKELYLQATLRWAMYDYGGVAGLQKAMASNKSFASFNPEQQASIVEDYFDSRKTSASHAYFVDPLLRDCPGPNFLGLRANH